MLDTSFVKGKPVQVLISAVQPAKAVAPASVTFDVDTAAAQGATTLSLIASVAVTLRKNQILVFGAVKVLVTADTPVGLVATAVPVDAVEGEEGDGIPAAIPDTASATWDQLYRVLGTSQSDFSIGENTQNLTSVTYDSGDALAWDESDATSKNWSFARQGRFKPDDYALRQIQDAAENDKELWLKHVTPREDGTPAVVRAGRVKIRGYSESNPSDGIIDASWTFQGQGKISRNYAS